MKKIMFLYILLMVNACSLSNTSTNTFKANENRYSEQSTSLKNNNVIENSIQNKIESLYVTIEKEINDIDDTIIKLESKSKDEKQSKKELIETFNKINILKDKKKTYQELLKSLKDAQKQLGEITN